MKVKSGSLTYDMSFIHSKDGAGVEVTTCTLKKGTKVIGSSVVKRFHTDPNDDKVAETFALVKALHFSKLDYKEKAAFVLAFKK